MSNVSKEEMQSNVSSAKGHSGNRMKAELGVGIG